MYFSDLCSGLHRLPNLQFVMIENDIYPSYSDHVTSTTLSGPPLARTWVPWHLRPERSNDAGYEHLYLVVQALSGTKRRVKHFMCKSGVLNGLAPWHFAVYGVTDPFARHMAIALRQLQTLELQITPRRHSAIDHGDVNALGYFPQLLEQLADLRYLNLIFISAERIDRVRRSTLTPFSDTCYSYSQVFPQCGK